MINDVIIEIAHRNYQQAFITKLLSQTHPNQHIQNIIFDLTVSSSLKNHLPKLLPFEKKVNQPEQLINADLTVLEQHIQSKLTASVKQLQEKAKPFKLFKNHLDYRTALIISKEETLREDYKGLVLSNKAILT